MVKPIINSELLDLCEAGLKFIRIDPILEEMMDRSNEVSLAEKMVDHGFTHALDVYSLTKQLIEQKEALSPGTFTRFFKITALAGALLHDVGRIMGNKDHAKNGAKIARKYLDTIRIEGVPLPRLFINRVVFIVRNHRAESWLNTPRKREFDGPDVVVVIIADKLCGSEARVPEELLNAMKLVAGISIPEGFRDQHGLDENWSLARIPWNRLDLLAELPAELVAAAERLLAKQGIAILPNIEIDRHDQVNGSIYERAIRISSDGFLQYAIRVDERLAPRKLVTGLDWWNDALHLATKAAAYLGLRFELEFNGQLLSYSKAVHDWLPVTTIVV